MLLDNLKQIIWVMYHLSKKIKKRKDMQFQKAMTLKGTLSSKKKMLEG